MAITLPYPDNHFRAIMIDPPWDHTELKFQGRRGSKRHDVEVRYNKLSVAEITAMGPELRRVAHQSCHLYMWTVNDFFAAAFQIMAAWGWEYVNFAPWVKTCTGLSRTHVGLDRFSKEELAIAWEVLQAMGMTGKPTYKIGYWLRNCTEPMLLGTNDRSFRFLNARVEPAIIWGAIDEHSRKPDTAYDLVRRNSPGPRLSVFERYPREGFECFGDQMPVSE
jgi:N6-adenosine-specific RNA methylase IME4